MNIAIVEDEEIPACTLKEYLDLYSKEAGVSFTVERFKSSEELLNNYRSIYSIVFLDIELPGINGMECARQLRKLDETITIIFVTNMSQYAQKGYEVDALDFVVKPVRYPAFRLKMKKAINIISQRTNNDITIKRDNGLYRTSIDKILYVEVFGHLLKYKLIDDTIETRGTLSGIEQTLQDSGFLRCNKCYLVNPKYIKGIHNYDIEMTNGEVLKISFHKKKEFMNALMKFYTGINTGDSE